MIADAQLEDLLREMETHLVGIPAGVYLQAGTAERVIELVAEVRAYRSQLHDLRQAAEIAEGHLRLMHYRLGDKDEASCVAANRLRAALDALRSSEQEAGSTATHGLPAGQQPS